MTPAFLGGFIPSGASKHLYSLAARRPDSYGEAGLSDEPNFACSEDFGKMRCYRFSPSTIRHERELLKKYHAEDFRGLIAETHVLLVGIYWLCFCFS